MMELRMIKQLQAQENDPDASVPPAPGKDERENFAALIDSINKVTEMASESAPAANGRRRTATATGAINPELTALSRRYRPRRPRRRIREGRLPPRACGAPWKDVPKALRASTSSPPISPRSSSAASSTTSGPSLPAMTSSPPSWRKAEAAGTRGCCSAAAAPARRGPAPNGCAPRRIGEPPLADRRSRRIALIGDTIAQVRSVMIEGVSGLLSIYPPDERPKLEVSRNQLVWDNGTIAQMFAADDPDSLRGPQFDAAWCDELCQVAPPGLRLGHAAVRAAARPLAAVRGHHHAARRSRCLKKIMRGRRHRRHPLAHPPTTPATWRRRSWPRCSAATATRRSAARSWRARSSRSA